MDTSKLLQLAYQYSAMCHHITWGTVMISHSANKLQGYVLKINHQVLYVYNKMQ